MNSTKPSNSPTRYIASVNINFRENTISAKTILAADTKDQAMLMLSQIYGTDNVLSIAAYDTATEAIFPSTEH